MEEEEQGGEAVILFSVIVCESFVGLLRVQGVLCQWSEVKEGGGKECRRNVMLILVTLCLGV